KKKKKKSLTVENAKQENEIKGEKEQDSNKEPLALPFPSWCMTQRLREPQARMRKNLERMGEKVRWLKEKQLSHSLWAVSTKHTPAPHPTPTSP
ncbi:hypothetical protein FD755_014282, partial [Muntiacus reevesi]